MNSSKIISIIVPCYNQAQYLDECLQSVINQTYNEWECIIVNDGSPDNTEQKAKEWVAKDNRFKYHYKINGGLSSARNLGIHKAVGTYILPLDADDKISNNFLEICLSEFLKDNGTDLVYGQLIKFGSKNQKCVVEPFTYQKLLEYNLFSCSSMYKIQDAKKIGLYDENLKTGLEDWDFWIRLLNENSNVKYNPSCAFFYRTKPNSMYDKLVKYTEEILKNKEYIFNKNIEKFKPKSNYVLYFENLQFQKKQLHPEKYISYKKLATIFLKKIRRTIILKFKLWDNKNNISNK